MTNDIRAHEIEQVNANFGILKQTDKNDKAIIALIGKLSSHKCTSVT